MSQTIPGISQEEIARRQKLLQDAYRFSPYIPDILRQQLEETLNPEQRELVLQLQILAIQFGRKLEAAERSNNVELPVIVMQHEPQPSNLVRGLMSRAESDVAANAKKVAIGTLGSVARVGDKIVPTEPGKIMIVPEHAMPNKVQ